MKRELTFFYLKHCPYCKKANEFLAELLRDPKYSDIEINRIEENENADIASQYEYFYVPCFYLGNNKLFEGAPTLDDIKMALDKTIEE
ncbi:MAG: thioredoxin family protein [Clostridia bacterium]